jgi:hypothetical protein
VGGSGREYSMNNQHRMSSVFVRFRPPTAEADSWSKDSILSGGNVASWVRNIPVSTARGYALTLCFHGGGMGSRLLPSDKEWLARRMNR